MANTKITSRVIADDAVTTAAIADDAVVTASIADDAITSALVADNAIGIPALAVSDGSAGQFLKTDGSGTLSFASAASSFESLTDTTVSTSDPATNTNPSTGVGTLWLNKNSGNMWCCTNATSNANVWANLGAGSTSYGADPTGGTITTAGGYKYHTFTSSGTFAAPLAKSGIDVLIVAGGAAGGGRYNSGGGGAGGMLEYTNQTANGSHTVTIGAGGAGG